MDQGPFLYIYYIYYIYIYGSVHSLSFHHFFFLIFENFLSLKKGKAETVSSPPIALLSLSQFKTETVWPGNEAGVGARDQNIKVQEVSVVVVGWKVEEVDRIFFLVSLLWDPVFW